MPRSSRMLTGWPILAAVGSQGSDLNATTHPGAPPSTAAAPALALTLVHPAEVAGKTIALSPKLVLGRSPGDDDIALIVHNTVSRRHATVERKFGNLLCLRDLESSNGTRVNGVRLGKQPVPLVDQTVVRLGDVLGVVVEDVNGTFDSDPILPGTSGRMTAARAALARAAPDRAPILVTGETGTGKERVAGEVHRQSGRRGRFLVLNCAELSTQLIESQLFGHERGAFTGATASKSGLFSAADGGTLFLDEIGELPLELQPKLLRVLQEGEIRPLGNSHTRRVDVRVVAATNRNLGAMVEGGFFRRDLLARLAVWEIQLPSVRQRKQDVFHWVGLLLTNWNRSQGSSSQLEFAPNVAEQILLMAWPDNLRGLDRLVHRLASENPKRPVGMSQAHALLPDLFPSQSTDSLPATTQSLAAVQPSHSSTSPPALNPGSDRGSAAAQPGLAHRVRATKPTREELLAAYESVGHSIRATARHFGKDRRQIYRWFDAYDLPRDSDD